MCLCASILYKQRFIVRLGHGAVENIALYIVAANPLQIFDLVHGLDSFCHRADVKFFTISIIPSYQCHILVPVRSFIEEQAVNFQHINKADFQQPREE